MPSKSKDKPDETSVVSADERPDAPPSADDTPRPPGPPVQAASGRSPRTRRGPSLGLRRDPLTTATVRRRVDRRGPSSAGRRREPSRNGKGGPRQRRFWRQARKAQPLQGDAMGTPATSRAVVRTGRPEPARTERARVRIRNTERAATRAVAGSARSGAAEDSTAPRKSTRKPSFEAAVEAMKAAGTEPMNVASLKALSITDLHLKARELGIETTARVRKPELIFNILLTQTKGTGLISFARRAGNHAGGLRFPAIPRVQLPSGSR